MMRWGFFILAGVVLSGCASRPAPKPVAEAPRIYDEAISAALVYDPPAISNQPPLDLSRDGRGQTAFAGFDEVITTFYYLRMDDYQQSVGRCLNDRFEREAITERVGVSYR